VDIKNYACFVYATERRFHKKVLDKKDTSLMVGGMRYVDIMDDGVMQYGSWERFCFKLISSGAVLLVVVSMDAAPDFFGLLAVVFVLWSVLVIGLLSAFQLFRIARRAIRGY
jgi:hypothetical protein